jgi:hypothetical protein
MAWAHSHGRTREYGGSREQPVAHNSPRPAEATALGSWAVLSFSESCFFYFGAAEGGNFSGKALGVASTLSPKVSEIY